MRITREAKALQWLLWIVSPSVPHELRGLPLRVYEIGTLDGKLYIKGRPDTLLGFEAQLSFMFINNNRVRDR